MIFPDEKKGIFAIPKDLMMQRIICAATMFIALCLNAQAQHSVKYEIPLPKSLQPAPDTVSVTFIGDVMMHARQLEYDCTRFLEPVRPMLSDADIAVANMEFTLAGEPYTGYPAFSAPDRYATYAADCGIDVFLTANNHILDKGPAGLRRTLGVYDSMRGSKGIHHTGTAADEKADTTANPLIVVGHGIRIAMVNFTYGTNAGGSSQWPSVRRASREQVAQDIARAKSRGADYIIALPHWGEEYVLRHGKWQQDWAEWLVSQGVDIIIGTHPHVVQDTTSIGRVPVIYSLGNAISNMSAPNTRLELAATVRFVRHHDGSTEMLLPELTWMWCTLPGMLTSGYATIPVESYLGRRDEWINPSDYDNMVATYHRVRKATGID